MATRSRLGRRRGAPFATSVFGVVGIAVGCASDGAAPRAGGADNEGSTGTGTISGATGGSPIGASGGSTGTGGPGADAGAEPGDSDEDPPLPPEREARGAFRAPVTTGRLVWTANPASGRVALIDSENLKVTVLDAGLGPTHLAALNDPSGEADVAIVLNVLGRDATLFRVAEDGGVSSETFPTHEQANRLTVSPGGSFAIAWTDFREFDAPDPTDGFQDVTVIEIGAGSARVSRVSVGYRPSEIAFDAEETRAFAVTEPGVSVIALGEGEATVTDLIELTDGASSGAAARDVAISANGEYAFVRVDGMSEISVVSLRDGERTPVVLSGPVTDLDLSEDGRRAVAVVRSNREIAVIPVPEILDAPTDFDSLEIPGEAFGLVSLSPDASRILLFMNAVASDRVTIVDGSAGETYLDYRTVTVHSPVENVSVAPDGRNALVEQVPVETSTKPGAFSIVPLDVERAPKIVATDAPLHSVAFMPGADSDRAVVTVRSDSPPFAAMHLVRLPTLQVDPLSLASPPIASGIVAESRKAYVAQEHPEGRITFVDLDSGEARTLTGFELAVKVVE